MIVPVPMHNPWGTINCSSHLLLMPPMPPVLIHNPWNMINGSLIYDVSWIMDNAHPIPTINL